MGPEVQEGQVVQEVQEGIQVDTQEDPVAQEAQVDQWVQKDFQAAIQEDLEGQVVQEDQVITSSKLYTIYVG